MFHKISFIIGISICSLSGCLAVFGQDGSPKLLSVFANGDDSEAFYTASQTLEAAAHNNGGYAVVRICSRLDLPDALATSSGKLGRLIDTMRKDGFPLDRLRFSTYSKCSPNSTATSPVEFWVSWNPKQPAFDISRLASTFDVSTLPYPSNQSEFSVNLKDFEASLNNDATLHGFVVGYYRRHISKSLAGRISQVRKAFSKEGRKMPKIYLRRWYGVPGDLADLDYPELIIFSSKSSYL